MRFLAGVALSLVFPIGALVVPQNGLKIAFLRSSLYVDPSLADYHLP